jgi:DNA/RNA-binding domain of Phe-tRNA-synthetase-like protein
MFVVSESWQSTYPGAVMGVLALGGVINPEQHAALEQRKAALEEALCARYAGHDRAALKALPAMQPYIAFYKRFKKSYHVQLQLESLVLKGKPLPRVAALVEAMFMAELNSLLLTAGHDLAVVQQPVGVYVADGSERFVRIDGQEQELKAGDMYVADALGVLSSVLYGPDQRTRITPGTQRVLFTTYGPPGIEPQAMQRHLEELRDNVLCISPGATVESLAVYPA